MDQVIQLNRDDDLFYVCSLIERSTEKRIVLVVPRCARALQSEYEVRLIRRMGDEANVPVGLVTNDLALREMADVVGLPCFASVRRSEKAKWNMSKDGRKAPSRGTALDDEVEVPRVPLLRRLGLTGIQLLATVLLFAGAALVLGIASIILVPAARITIAPAALTVSDSREVILDPTVTTIDLINGIIPISSFQREISGTATIATTKSNTAPADRSSGEVVFTNLTGTPAEIPVSTTVETSSGVTVRFSTVVTADLPSGYNARVTVPIAASDPGPSGNVKALQINVIEGPLSSVVRVINTTATTGGSIKKVHVVSFDDKTVLRQRLEEELRTAAIARLQSEAGSDQFVPPASVQVTVLSESFDHLVDDPAESLTLHVEAVAVGALVDPADLQTFSERALASKVPKGYSVLPGTLRVEPDVNARVEANSVVLQLNSHEQATPMVNREQVLAGVNGKPIVDAKRTISSRVRLIGPPRVELSPSWWTYMPFLSFRTAFFVQSGAEAKAP